MAWVKGTEIYATLVDIEDEELTSACTCPYGDVCKHAVALVLEYMEKLNQNVRVPTVDEGDKRLTMFEDILEKADNDENENTENNDAQVTPDTIRLYLDKQSKAELVALIGDIYHKYPEVRHALQDRSNVSLGKVSSLVNAVRKEIDRLSAEPDWSDQWEGGEGIPDYSGVRDRLEMLLAKGYADQVVELGKRLLESGTRQVEMCDDEGETAEEIASCMEIIFKALPQSTLPPAGQMLWAVEAELEDEYDLCAGAQAFWEQERAAADWNTLATELLQRLDKPGSGKGDRFSRSYHRENLTDWIIEALDNAGRQSEVIPLCEQEALKTQSYVRLVERLLEAGRTEEAEGWINKGIKATQKEWPGITSQLRGMLRGMREKKGDLLYAAALLAGDFFARPALESFKELRKGAERAGVWPAVRAAAMYFLETGELPEGKERTVGDRIIPQWPLPETGLSEAPRQGKQDFPDTGTLIRIAIAEKQPDEVIRWYDRSGVKSSPWLWTWFQEDRVAEAVKDAYPERAIAIWRKLAEGEIAQAKPKAYEQAAGFLLCMSRVMRKTGKEGEWQSYLAGLRQVHARKRRLLEILDGLERRQSKT